MSLIGALTTKDHIFAGREDLLQNEEHIKQLIADEADVLFKSILDKFRIPKEFKKELESLKIGRLFFMILSQKNPKVLKYIDSENLINSFCNIDLSKCIKSLVTRSGDIPNLDSIFQKVSKWVHLSNKSQIDTENFIVFVQDFPLNFDNEPENLSKVQEILKLGSYDILRTGKIEKHEFRMLSKLYKYKVLPSSIRFSLPRF